MIKRVEYFVSSLDGAKFESEEEAMRHELELNKYNEHVEFYDVNGIQINPLEVCWEAIEYINVKTEKGISIIKDIIKYLEIGEYIPTTVGLFKFAEWKEDYWATPADYLEYVKNEWAVSVNWPF